MKLSDYSERYSKEMEEKAKREEEARMRIEMEKLRRAEEVRLKRAWNGWDGQRRCGCNGRGTGGTGRA